MKKTIVCILIAVLTAQSLVACSILPKSKQQQLEESELMEQQRATYIEQSKMKYLFDHLMKLPPILTEEEKARQDAALRQKMPFRVPTAELINYCTTQANNQVQLFLSEYSTDKYESNVDGRALKKIYNGNTEQEINGGTKAKVTGSDIGYWRITDCTYYNQAFFTNEKDNSVRLLYRCKMYHYLLKNADNLANTPQNDGVMTTENTDVKEYENAFLVVTINNVCPVDTQKSLEEIPLGLQPEVLMFTDYESAIKSIAEPQHTFKNLYLPSDFKGTIVDGYIGKPLVVMPDMIGQFVDVSAPDNIAALDELGIQNYKVIWEENDGSKIAYSILNTSVAPGNIVDITDRSKESTIEVVVASKATPSENQPEEGSSEAAESSEELSE